MIKMLLQMLLFDGNDRGINERNNDILKPVLLAVIGHSVLKGCGGQPGD